MRKKGYFKSLKSHTDSIKYAFSLIEERKIEKFTAETIENLLNGGEEGFQMMQQKPKIITLRSSEEIRNIIGEILSNN